jgi:hypothetical protein
VHRFVVEQLLADCGVHGCQPFTRDFVDACWEVEGCRVGSSVAVGVIAELGQSTYVARSETARLATQTCGCSNGGD